MKRLLILAGLCSLISACATDSNTALSNSNDCEIVNNERTQACYISSSKPGCIDISDRKTACKRGESCDIPAYNVTTTYNNKGSNCTRKPSTKNATTKSATE